ncbi:MAG: endo-1,4-beta-xylanase [Planctomycetaceae bacterium]|nr:endo-1,4-beta-xylanase [Planctomycetaceae bacterium]
MGVMRFLVQPSELLDDWPEVHRAYVTGFDRHVFPTQVELEGNLVKCQRPHSDSGKLHVAFPVEQHGRPVLTTTSLREREEPYLLPLELARGKIAELRDQSSAWEIIRMEIPESYRVAERRAFQLLAQASAVQNDPDECCRIARRALTAACDASDVLLKSYTSQRIAVCHRAPSNPPASLGCGLPWGTLNEETKDLFCSTFQAAAIPIEWKRVEPVEGQYHWDIIDQLVDCCAEHRQLPRGGPLIDLGAGGLPQWLQPWEHDILNMQSFVCDWVETAVSRYQGRIRLWEVSAYGNSGGALAISEENRLGLVARTLETAGRNDDDAQLFIRIDQPWGDYQARGHHRLSPFQFVDAVVRSNLGLAGVNLEINVGYRPRGGSSRDMLSFSRLIDYWSMLGIQIHVTLAFPSDVHEDPNANQDLEVATPVWRRPCNEDVQAEWVETFVPLLMSKPAVTGVYWTHLTDAFPHQFPHAGLIRADGTPKPSFEALRSQLSFGTTQPATL